MAELIHQYDNQGMEIGDGTSEMGYSWQHDQNVDPDAAVTMFYRAHSKGALIKAIKRLSKAGWVLEHYHGTRAAVLARGSYYAEDTAREKAREAAQANSYDPEDPSWGTTRPVI